MSDVKVDDVLEYLSVWKTRREIAEKFSLSPTESIHLITWLRKGKYIIQNNVNFSNKKQNKVFLYKSAQ